MTGGGSSLPEVQRLLRALAAGRRAAEVGTAYGEGAAAIAATAASLVTVELDPARAAAAEARLAACANVELLVGDWRDLLPSRGPFELVFLDAGPFKARPDEDGPLAVRLLTPGGLLVVDDLTPGRSRDPAREWLFGHPELAAAEVLTTPAASAVVAARAFPSR